MGSTKSPPVSGFNRRSFIAGAAGSAMIPLTARAAAPANEASKASAIRKLPVRLEQIEV